jgi:Right handed beta helix region
MTGPRGRRKARRLLIAATMLAALAVPVIAYGHIERSSYWPDPAPDKSVKPAAGGKVPKARTLGSALKKKPPGRTRVVCQRNSLKMLKADVADARANGFDLRPTDHRTLSAKKAKNLTKINKALFARCRFHQIQPAVTASGNNDRVVIMPGVYTEPTSRAQPTNDPKCQKYRITNDQGASAVSYKYQFNCPNDQNLIAVMGREPGKKDPPDPPLEDRNGIPDLGPCIRCNMQIEGSGPSPDNVVIDAGRVASGNGAPIDAVKDVGIRADRADGFVLRNMTVRHAAEHDIYILESDGYLFNRFKTFYAGEYGVLTFVEDHGLMENCEAAGNGDSGLYPGAGAEGGVQRPAGEPFHYTQEIRFCDSHHNAGGYSGTDGNSTWVHDNNWYDNALGFTTDVFTAPGHPGFPQDSDLIENNNFYDNNFNPYEAGSDVVPTIPVPVGTGLWIAGGNDNIIRNNHFFNNWRRGAMLFAVPDQTICAPAGPTSNHVTGCDPSSFGASTSYNNQFYGNTMGVAPDGSVQPNGTDFWWDSYVTNTGNCWFDNHPAPGKSITSDPGNLPDCNNGQDRSLSQGSGNPPAESELLGCFVAFSGGGYNPATCPWFTTPSKP